MNNKELLEQFIAHFQTVNRFLRSSVFDRQDRTVTRVQWMLLNHISCHGKRTIGQLAEHLDVRPSTMSQMIDRLEKVRLVSRETDSNDARVKLVSLTDEGSELIRQTEHLWTEALTKPFGQFHHQEKEQLLALMKTLADSLPRSRSEKEKL